MTEYPPLAGGGGDAARPDKARPRRDPLDRFDLPLAPDAHHNLTDEEVRVMWAFIHGDIMDEQTRKRLRKRWGLCTRHAWGSALAEIELWHTGAGVRGGHQPFDSTILYEDLLGRMSHQLSRTGRRGRPKLLRGKGTCTMCDDIDAPALPGVSVTHAGFSSSVLAVEANEMVFTSAWFAETAPQWRDAVARNARRLCRWCVRGRRRYRCWSTTSAAGFTWSTPEKSTTRRPRER